MNKEYSENDNEQYLALLGKPLHNLAPKLRVTLLLFVLPRITPSHNVACKRISCYKPDFLKCQEGI